MRMSEEQIALAKRAVACKGWRLMPGMLVHVGFRVVWADETTFRSFDERGNEMYGSTDCLLPDLTDPATLGCLLALVREHHKEPRLAVVPNGKGWSVSRVWLRSPHDRVAGVHTLEAEALVAALEAAP
jgi:hypothetical protein